MQSFIHVTDGSKWRADDPLIHGLNIDIAVDAFKERICWLTDRYEIVSLNSIVGPAPLRTNRPKLLLCFDDWYNLSVLELAAPILHDHGVPWCFFINPRFVGNTALPVDNIVAYIANVHGIERLIRARRKTDRHSTRIYRRLSFQNVPSSTEKVIQGLTAKLNIDTNALARKSRLILKNSRFGKISHFGVEIGNHTFDHVHCRTLD